MESRERVIIVASADVGRRQTLRSNLQQKRWKVLEAAGGAAALAYLEQGRTEALILDSWLPDLEAGALADMVQQIYPAVDLLRLGGMTQPHRPGSQKKYELLHAIQGVEASWIRNGDGKRQANSVAIEAGTPRTLAGTGHTLDSCQSKAPCVVSLLPDMVGDSEAMRKLARLVRLVAPHSARVLIEGETGSGKELVARAVHTLSGRGAKPFVALNCAAIPETLLEAELFGHTRGAFTGAVQSRLGRIESANGGTLFLDEIGELPLALQAKLLRFLENGEIQRIGGNETLKLDVRVVSATHQMLEDRAEQGSFRLDLYHRLATFPVQVPPLRDRKEDLSMLVEAILKELGHRTPRKFIGAAALHRLAEHPWPGNVRELQNVLQRAVILSETRTELKVADLVFGPSRGR